MVRNYRTAQVSQGSFRSNFSKHNFTQLSYFPNFSVHREDEILQAERGTPQLTEEPSPNYRTAPEYPKRTGVKYSKHNPNYRTAEQ